MVHVDYTQQLPQDGMVTNLPVYEKAGASVCVCVWMGHGGVLTKHSPLEKGMANHYSILALRTP